MLQWGQRMIFPHSEHWTAGAQDLLERRIITCSPLSSLFLIASISFREKLPTIPFFRRSLMVSITIISESGAPWNLSPRVTSEYFPFLQLYSDSKDGVAEPSKTEAPCRRASITAASLALYLGAGESCL